jgi:hypothetical protein
MAGATRNGSGAHRPSLTMPARRGGRLCAQEATRAADIRAATARRSRNGLRRCAMAPACWPPAEAPRTLIAVPTHRQPRRPNQGKVTAACRGGRSGGRKRARRSLRPAMLRTPSRQSVHRGSDPNHADLRPNPGLHRPTVRTLSAPSAQRLRYCEKRLGPEELAGGHCRSHDLGVKHLDADAAGVDRVGTEGQGQAPCAVVETCAACGRSETAAASRRELPADGAARSGC